MSIKNISDESSTTYQHYDGNNVVAETDENNNVIARYAYLPGDYKPYSMTKYNELPGHAALTYYFQYNARGDVTSFTDQWGTVVAKYSYDPWGNPLTITDGLGSDVADNPAHRANTNPIRYAGYRYDTESGLYYLTARYYDPSTYRFLTRDADGGDNNKPLTQNLYAYAGDNPVMKVDPDGDYWHWHITIWHTEHDIMYDPFFGNYWWYDRHFTKRRWRKYAKTKVKFGADYSYLGLSLAKRTSGQIVKHFPKSSSKRRTWHRHFDTTNAPLSRVPLPIPVRAGINVYWGLKGWLFEKGTYRLPVHVQAVMGAGGQSGGQAG